MAESAFIRAGLIAKLHLKGQPVKSAVSKSAPNSHSTRGTSKLKDESRLGDTKDGAYCIRTGMKVMPARSPFGYKQISPVSCSVENRAVSTFVCPLTLSAPLQRLTAIFYVIVTVCSLLLGCCLSAVCQATIRVPADVDTIQSAIIEAHDGDTVLVAPGSYHERLIISGKTLRLQADGPYDHASNSVTLQGDGRNPVITIEGIASDRPEISGFTVQGGLGDDVSTCGGIAIAGASPEIDRNTIMENQSCGISIGGSSDTTLDHNDIRDNHGSGVLITSGNQIRIAWNLIQNNTVPPNSASTRNRGAGVLVQSLAGGSGVTALALDHNTISGNTADTDSAFAQQIGAPISDLQFINNFISGNSTRSEADATQVYISGSYPDAAQQTFTNLLQVNNTIVGGGEVLVLQFGRSQITNNVFFNTTSHPANISYSSLAGLSCSSANNPSVVAITNNDIFNVGSPIDGACRLGMGNLAVDPGLRSIESGDLRESDTSPLLNGGDPNVRGLPDIDLDAKSRVVCGKVDIGGYEAHPRPRIVLTSSLNPSPGGADITLTASLSGNCNTPTGEVSFVEGTKVLGSGSLSSQGIASLTTNTLSVGVHLITAVFLGDVNFDRSQSSLLTEVITGPTTSISLASVLPASPEAFQALVWKATVTSAYTVPGGSISFLAGDTVLLTVPVGTDGTAVATTDGLERGHYLLRAIFNGNQDYAGSISNPRTLDVVGLASETQLQVESDHDYLGQTTNVFVKVFGTKAGVLPTGEVQLFDGSSLISTMQLSGGMAKVTPTLSEGTHSLVAKYLGDGRYAPSTSVGSAVTTLSPAFRVMLQPAIATVRSGESVDIEVSAIGLGAFSDQLRLLSGQAPEYTLLKFATPTLTLLTGSGSTKLSIITGNVPTGLNRAYSPVRSNVGLALAAGLMIAPLFIRMKFRLNLLSAYVLTALLLNTVGCTTISRTVNALAPGTYSIPITAYDDVSGISDTATLTLIVTP